ncbi:MAG: hypothetical protein GF408_02685 [Candidatus Omnitrophica bacterium]|nr:hypothetical protein [Candidatus Omnitrophota bacterium]
MHRTQILFPKWLNEYVDVAAKKCDISKGEMIRAMTCIGIIKALTFKNAGPEKYDQLMKTFGQIMKDSDKKLAPERIADFHDDLFYETRKTLEKRIKALKEE